jgi:hypothetical protein
MAEDAIVGPTGAETKRLSFHWSLAAGFSNDTGWRHLENLLLPFF